MPSAAQLAANRANAQLSTGPTTPEGKAKVSLNAVKTALTGATVLLPTDDVALYQQHTANAFAAWQPATDREKILVQSILDTEWRLLRIPALQAGIYALGRLTHAELFADQPESVRPALLEAYIFQTYRRDLTNLSLQERRLRNQREKDIAELERLQQERRRRREEQLNAAAHMYERYEENGDAFDPAAFGFEFSIEEIEERVGLWEAKRIRCQYPQQFARYIHAKLLRDERLGLVEEEEAA